MTLWGGRFTEEPSDVLWAYTVSTADRRLLGDDVAGSLAHVGMLGEQGIIAPEAEAELSRGLQMIRAEAERNEFEFTDGDEDVHSAVERRLRELVGEVAGKLHTGRSRNDQVALDLRLYLHRSVEDIVDGLHRLAGVLADKAEEVGDTVVASYTHLQQAQPVPLAHHLLAYAWMALRDADRFRDADRRIAVSPLGASAGGGSALPLDPAAVARRLELPAVFENSLDAVASRDFAAEYAFCCAQAMVHLSRLSEELVLWATTEFGWARYADRHTTGSSALPQKRNPDIAELARGRAAMVIGDVTALLALQKGLPLAYNRDLQEDKESVFHAGDVLAGSLAALGAMIADARFDPPPPSAGVVALDLAEVLVERGVPFREAHEAVGRLITALESRNADLGSATAAELEATHAGFVASDLGVVDPAGSVRRRRSPGGGSMAAVAGQLAAIRAVVSSD